MSSNETPGLDLGKLSEYLRAHSPELGQGALSAELATGGRSNLTYFIHSSDRNFVLRRPPLGHVLATAHDMSREYRIMGALANTNVSVPQMFHLCADIDIIGAPFYLMELVEGRILQSERETRKLPSGSAERISENVINTLGNLHECDITELGLSDFGRAEGFLERQVTRWSKQLVGSKSRPLVGMDELLTRLANEVPTTQKSSIVHGDFRLDNCIINDDDSVAAVIDWEMATIGDSFTDLGLFVVYWDGIAGGAESPIASGIRREFGFPTARELLNRYALRTGSDLEHIEWYIAFGFFKLAVILEGIYLRYTQGKTVGVGFDQIGALVEPLVACGHAALGGE